MLISTSAHRSQDVLHPLKVIHEHLTFLGHSWALIRMTTRTFDRNTLYLNTHMPPVVWSEHTRIATRQSSLSEVVQERCHRSVHNTPKDLLANHNT